jgi:diguanylate cyclase (GGDEF)-like protein
LNGELNIVDATRQVLKLVGEQLKVSRAYMILLPGKNVRNVHQWYAPELDSDLKMTQTEAEAFTPAQTWKQILENDGIVLVSDAALLPEEIKYDLDRSHVNAMVEFPIWDMQKRVGVFGVTESAKKSREWTAEEVQFLYHIGVLFAGIVKRYNLRMELQTQNEILTIIMDQLDMDVFVADVDTHKILFANKSMQQNYHFSPFEEDVYCYDVAGTNICRENCRLDDVKKNDGKLIISDSFSDITHRHYRNYDSIIPWSGERKKVHLHYAMDISQLHKYQDQIKLFTSMDIDIFTTTLSKDSFINAVKNLSKTSSDTHFMISICIVKVMDLESINEKYGDLIGDDLIQTTAKVLRKTFRSYDIIGRYSNNEFVLALSSCTEALAKTKLSSALASLIELSITNNWGFEPMLQYGIAMNTEITINSESDDYLETLILMAQKRMQE